MTDSVAVFPPGFRVLDALGDPVAGATIEFYNAGTTTAKTVYLNNALTTSLGSTVYCDSAGHPVAGSGSTTKVLIYTGTADYKCIIKDGSGAVLATFDDVKGAAVAGSSGGGGSSGITQSAADLRYVRNANALSAAASLDGTDIIPIWDTGSLSNRGITYSAFKSDLVSEIKADGNMFGTGTRCLFQQTSAPTGWTKVTTYDDYALRLTSGAVGDGGSVDFTTAFASKSLSGTVGSTTLTEAQIPAHDHDFTAALDGTGTYSLSGGGNFDISQGLTTATAGGGGSHTHSLTMTAVNLAVRYVDLILASKT